MLRADLAAAELDERVDAVFSNAVFHWVARPRRPVSHRMHAALRPGGRLVAQCGGAGNVERFHGARSARWASASPFAQHLAGWRGPWNFAGRSTTRASAWSGPGFADVEVWLEPHPVVPDHAARVPAHGLPGPPLERLPDELRAPYVAAVAERCGQPLELDYVRLNMAARA